MHIRLGMARGLAITVLSLGLAVGAAAQTLDLEALRADADAGNVEAQVTLGEALVYGVGGAEIDASAGQALLTKAVSAGDPGAKASLGKLLLDGVYLPVEPANGERLLGEAAQSGHVGAQVTLGSAYLFGYRVESNPEHAKALLGAAAENGNTEAMRLLGEQLITGQLLERDVAAGRAMLEQAAKKGDPKAGIKLGSLFLEGAGVDRDERRALAYFEQAAVAGDGSGLERYGERLLWGQRDTALAEKYLTRAGELGQSSAWATLAEGAMYGYLGKGSRAKFEGYAEKARSAGVEQAEVLEAHRLMWGISKRASGPETLAHLEKAAAEGNRLALRFLVGLVRDGNRYNVRKEPERARGYLEEYGSILKPVEVAQLELSIDVAETRAVSGFGPLVERYDSHPEYKSRWFGEELTKANPNFAIYLLQRQMTENGTYGGAINGMATKSTLRAMWKECRTLDDQSGCEDSIMRNDVIGTLLAR